MSDAEIHALVRKFTQNRKAYDDAKSQFELARMGLDRQQRALNDSHEALMKLKLTRRFQVDVTTVVECTKDDIIVHQTEKLL